MTTSLQTTVSQPNSQGFDELLEQIAARLQEGQTIDVESYITGHPEHAERLRRLVPTMQALAEFGSAGAASAPLVSDDPHPVGAALGDFRILREIGRGGMGIVYEAEQMSLSRRVALKVLPFAATLDPRQLQRFKHEAQAAAGFHHPNIVPVFFVGCERGVHFYAMQLIEGQTLAAAIAQMRNAERGAPSDSFSLPSAGEGSGARGHSTLANGLATERSKRSPSYYRSVAQIGIQAAEALEHAHQLGVVHRDIKPANLLLDVRGNVWITDFGLALLQCDNGLTMTGDLLGTLRYMSPEQALGKRGLIDARADIYSLGATLYELLTLEPPFTGHDRQQLLLQIEHEDPLPPRQFTKSVAVDLETIVLKAMEKNLSDRYSSAQELANDLQRYLQDKPIAAQPATLARRMRKWSARNKTLTTSLVVVLLIGLFVLGWHKVQRDRQTREIADFVRESLSGARVAMTARDYALCREKLVDAQRRLAQARTRQGRMSTELSQLQSELSARIASIDKLQEFFRFWELSHRELNAFDRFHEQGSRALSIYRVLDRADWTGDLQKELLEPAQLQEIKEKVYEVLLLLSDYLIRWHSDPAKRGNRTKEEAIRESLRYLDLAAACHIPTRAYFHLRSRCWRHLGDSKAQQEELERMENTQATLALDHFILGRDASWDGNKEEAFRHFRAALRINPKHEASLYFTGRYLVGIKRYEEAVLAFTAVIAVQPSSWSSHCYRSLCHRIAGRNEEANEDAHRAVELSSFFTTYAFIAQHFDEVDELVQAADAWATIFERDITNVCALNGAAWCLAKDPEIGASSATHAVELAKRAIDLDPSAGQVWNTLGVAQYRTGDWTAAIESLIRSTELDSGEYEAFNTFFLAMANWQLGKNEDAARWYESAVVWMKERRMRNGRTIMHAWVQDRELSRFRMEAASLLGVPEGENSPGNSE